MKTILLYSILFISFTLNAQDFEWVTQHSTANESWTVSSTIDANNNIISVGEFDGTIDLDPAPNATANFTSLAPNGKNVFVQKLDENGDYIWGLRIGSGIGAPFPKKVIVDNNNDIIIVGNFLSTQSFNPNGNYYLTSNGGYDGFIAKYSGADGSFIWAMQLGGTAYDSIKDVAIANDFETNINHNTFVVVGGFSETVNFNPLGSSLNITSNGDLDIFAMKYDASNGHLLFDYVVGGTGADFATSVDIKNELPSSNLYENVILTGQFNSDSNGIDFAYSNTEDFIIAPTENYPFITLLGTNFNYIRTNTIDISDTLTKDYKIAFNDFGLNFYVTGNFEGEIALHNNQIENLTFFDQTVAGAFVLQGNINSSNFIYSGMSILGDTYIKPKDLIVRNTNAYLLGNVEGQNNIMYNGNVIGNISSSSMKDIFLLSFGTNFNLFFNSVFGGIGNDLAYSIDGYIPDYQSSSYGYFSISGSFQNTVDFDLSTDVNELTANGNIDGYTLKLNSGSPTTGILNNELMNISVYPNPTTDVVTFKSDEIIKTITIYDIQGRKILQTKPIDNQISIAHLNKGIYFLKTKINGKIATKKIIKK